MGNANSVLHKVSAISFRTEKTKTWSGSAAQFSFQIVPLYPVTLLVSLELFFPDQEHVEDQLGFLQHVLVKNGYGKEEVERILRASKFKQQSKESEEGVIKEVVVLPYCKTVTNRKNIRATSHPPREIRQLMQDPLGLAVPGLYRIPCTRGSRQGGALGSAGKNIRDV